MLKINPRGRWAGLVLPMIVGGALFAAAESSVSRAEDSMAKNLSRPASGVPEIVRIETGAAISEHALIPREYLSEGSLQPLAGSKIFYENADKTVRAGVWEAGPGTVKINMAFDEYVRVIEGVTTLRSADGRSWTFKPGDSFMLPKGFRGEAEQKAHFRKEFVDMGVPK